MPATTTFIFLGGSFCCWLVAASKRARGARDYPRYVFEWSNLAQALRSSALRPAIMIGIAPCHELRFKPLLLLLGRRIIETHLATAIPPQVRL